MGIVRQPPRMRERREQIVRIREAGPRRIGVGQIDDTACLRSRIAIRA